MHTDNPAASMVSVAAAILSTNLKTRKGSMSAIDYQRIEIADLSDPAVVRALFLDARRVARSERRSQRRRAR